MCEYIHGFNLLEIRKKFIVFNGLLVFGIFLAVYIVSNRVKWSLMLTYVLIIVASSMNYYVNIFRGEAVSAADIYCVGTALNVVGDYTFAITPEVFICILTGAVLLSFFSWIPKEKPVFHKWPRLVAVLVSVTYIAAMIWVFAISDWPKEQGLDVKVFKPMKSYKQNGELLNFVRGFYFMLVKEPEGYSTEACLELMDSLGYESDTAAYDDGEENPNIIYIMNESLTDFSIYDQIGLSEDPFSYIHSLKGQDNVIFGNLHVDVFGGRTANTEYEIQTGNALYYVPKNAVPYSMYVRKPSPALTWNMTDIGYCGNEAMHPFRANGYSRPRAYANLGFKRFVALEDMAPHLQPEDYIRRYVSDSANFRYIEKLYEEAKSQSDAPYYIYNVTMQNHGSFTDDYANFVQDIEITGDAFKDLDAIEDTKRFINLTQFTDEAFRELTAYFSNVKEHTILIMYGDHLPQFHNDFYKTLWGKKPSELKGRKRFQRYTTPLIIWANYDINADGRYNEIFEDISVNYLSAEIMNIAGLPMTAYQKFLVDMQKEVPVLTYYGMLDRNGRYYRENQKEYPFSAWLKNYHYLVYNYQFDEGNRNDAYFTLQSDHSSLDAYEAGN